jgi:hypothetical protein
MTLFGFSISNPAASLLLFAAGLLLLVSLTRLYFAVIHQLRRVESHWKDVETALQQRGERVPALLSAFTGIASVERELAAVRAVYPHTQEYATPTDRIRAEQELSRSIAALLDAAERIPVTTSGDFSDIADFRIEMRAREQYIAEARERYNEAAEILNLYRQGFPAALFVRSLAPEAAPVFVAADTVVQSET